MTVRHLCVFVILTVFCQCLFCLSQSHILICLENAGSEDRKLEKYKVHMIMIIKRQIIQIRRFVKFLCVRSRKPNIYPHAAFRSGFNLNFSEKQEWLEQGSLTVCIVISLQRQHFLLSIRWPEFEPATSCMVV